MEKTAAQILHEHSPNKDANYETSWIIAAMQEYNAQALNASTVLLNEATKTVTEATLHSSQLKEELERLQCVEHEYITSCRVKEEELSALREALEKINTIRNSIVGLQRINWSEHIYPLVAALNEAGVQGMPYPEAQKHFGTMLDRTVKAEAELSTLREENERLRKALLQSLSMIEQTLSYREMNGLTMGNVFLQTTIDDAKSALHPSHNTEEK